MYVYLAIAVLWSWTQTAADHGPSDISIEWILIPMPHALIRSRSGDVLDLIPYRPPSSYGARFGLDQLVVAAGKAQFNFRLYLHDTLTNESIRINYPHDLRPYNVDLESGGVFKHIVPISIKYGVDLLKQKSMPHKQTADEEYVYCIQAAQLSRGSAKHAEENPQSIMICNSISCSSDSVEIDAEVSVMGSASELHVVSHPDMIFVAANENTALSDKDLLEDVDLDLRVPTIHNEGPAVVHDEPGHIAIMATTISNDFIQTKNMKDFQKYHVDDEQSGPFSSLEMIEIESVSCPYSDEVIREVAEQDHVYSHVVGEPLSPSFKGFPHFVALSEAYDGTEVSNSGNPCNDTGPNSMNFDCPISPMDISDIDQLRVFLNEITRNYQESSNVLVPLVKSFIVPQIVVPRINTKTYYKMKRRIIDNASSVLLKEIPELLTSNLNQTISVVKTLDLSNFEMDTLCNVIQDFVNQFQSFLEIRGRAITDVLVQEFSKVKLLRNTVAGLASCIIKTAIADFRKQFDVIFQDIQGYFDGGLPDRAVSDAGISPTDDGECEMEPSLDSTTQSIPSSPCIQNLSDNVNDLMVHTSFAPFSTDPIIQPKSELCEGPFDAIRSEPLPLDPVDADGKGSFHIDETGPDLNTVNFQSAELLQCDDNSDSMQTTGTEIDKEFHSEQLHESETSQFDTNSQLDEEGGPQLQNRSSNTSASHIERRITFHVQEVALTEEQAQTHNRMVSLFISFTEKCLPGDRMARVKSIEGIECQTVSLTDREPFHFPSYTAMIESVVENGASHVVDFAEAQYSVLRKFLELGYPILIAEYCNILSAGDINIMIATLALRVLESFQMVHVALIDAFELKAARHFTQSAIKTTEPVLHKFLQDVWARSESVRHKAFRRAAQAVMPSLAAKLITLEHVQPDTHPLKLDMEWLRNSIQTKLDVAEIHAALQMVPDVINDLNQLSATDRSFLEQTLQTSADIDVKVCPVDHGEIFKQATRDSLRKTLTDIGDWKRFTTAMLNQYRLLATTIRDNYIGRILGIHTDLAAQLSGTTHDYLQAKMRENCHPSECAGQVLTMCNELYILIEKKIVPLTRSFVPLIASDIVKLNRMFRRVLTPDLGSQKTNKIMKILLNVEKEVEIEALLLAHLAKFRIALRYYILSQIVQKFPLSVKVIIAHKYEEFMNSTQTWLLP